MNGALSDFWYWLNANFLMSSESIIMLQKKFFSHGFLCDSSLFFVGKEWKKFRQ